MRVHILQHVPFEGLGSIASWLKARQAELSYTRFFESPALPPISELDLIIALGGPMSVNDEAEFAWLREEKQFLNQALAQGVRVLGICLGAQLIASALGSRVYRNTCQEIGWFPIRAARHGGDGFRFPETGPAFHWHGETFELPAGAVRLAGSEACENQAFQLGRRVIGLQCHLETTPENVEALLANCREEITSGPFVQSERELRETDGKTYEKINRLMDEVLCYLTARES